MANPLSSITLAEVQADLAAVESVVALVAKYDHLLPLPASVKTGVADFDNFLKFAEAVASDV